MNRKSRIILLFCNTHVFVVRHPVEVKTKPKLEAGKKDCNSRAEMSVKIKRDALYGKGKMKNQK